MYKGILISEGVLTLVTLPKKVPNLNPEQKVSIFSPLHYLINLFKLSAQGRDLALFFGNVTKVKIPSEIKPPLDCGSAYLVRNTNRTVWDFFCLPL